MTITRKFAADDGNLNSGAVITARQRKYIDLDLDFSVNPDTGDIYKKKDAAAVKEAVKNIVLTDFYDRPFQPFVGSGVAGLLFELADDITNIEIKENIRRAIENHEPRARVINIVVQSAFDRNSLDATIEFVVVSTQQQVSLRLTLNRLR